MLSASHCHSQIVLLTLSFATTSSITPNHRRGSCPKFCASFGRRDSYFTVNVHHPIYAVASSVHGAWQRMGVKLEIGPFADHTVHLTLRRARNLFARQPVRILDEASSVTMTKARARQSAPRHLGDRLKRVFFKNALYEVVAIREA